MNEYFEIQVASKSAQYCMFCNVSPKCSKIFFDIVQVCFDMGVKPIITSMIRKKTTDTGIHAVGRAIDFIIDYQDRDLSRPKVIKTLLSYVNDKYVYDYSKEYKTLIYHKVGGDFGGFHFHLQTSI